MIPLISLSDSASALCINEQVRLLSSLPSSLFPSFVPLRLRLLFDGLIADVASESGEKTGKLEKNGIFFRFEK